MAEKNILGDLDNKIEKKQGEELSTAREETNNFN